MKYANNRALFGFTDIWTCKTIWAHVGDDRKIL